MTQAAPGWYPDPTPAKAGDVRYWDGARWTEHVHEAVEPTPTPEPVHVVEPTAAATPAAASAAPAAWHPDPRVPGQLRYWDGTDWTAHVSPAPESQGPRVMAPIAPSSAPQSTGPSERRKGRGKRWVWVTVTSVTVLAVAGTGIGLWALRDKEAALPECDALFDTPEPNVEAAQTTVGDVVCTDSEKGLDYTAPMRDLTDRELLLSFPATVSHEDESVNTAQSLGEWSEWGFALFADPSLSVRLPILVTDKSLSDGGGWTIESDESPVAFLTTSYEYAQAHGIEEVTAVPTIVRDNYDMVEDPIFGGEVPDYSQWGLRDTYYLVRYIDVDGKPLDRPVVSEFSFTHELDTPSVTRDDDPSEPGTVLLSWNSIDDADRYLIIRGLNSVDEQGAYQQLRTYSIIGETTNTTWSANESFQNAPVDTGGGAVLWQNSGLETYYNCSLDDECGEEGTGYVEGELGVIAVKDNPDGTVTTSGFTSAMSQEDFAELVYTFADNTWAKDFSDGSVEAMTFFGSQEELPTTVPIVTLDGRVAQMSATLVGSSAVKLRPEWGENVYSVELFAAGTRLATTVAIEASADGDIYSQIEAFNERSMLDAPQTGAFEATQAYFPVTEAMIMSTAPKVDFPFQGTDEFVMFLGNHLVARSEGIDYSAWLEQPGLPAIDDAMDEAIAQNPYAYVDNYFWDDTTIWVEYSYEPDEYRAHQDELKAGVDSAVASIMRDGMSQRDKAIAINDYLADAAEYDYDALAAYEAYVQAGGVTGWREYARETDIMHAWEANGVWSHDHVVCAGYSKAYVAIALSSDMVAVYVSGIVTQSNGRHAWNKVNVDGTWWSMDTTWNDGGRSDDFLLISDSDFTGSATRTEGLNWVLDDRISSFATP